MNYDQTIQKAEELIVRLEQAEALGMDEYKRLASEAASLLKQCKAEIEGIANELAQNPQ